MPTQRPRHTVTETPPVQRALRRLRALDPEAAIDLKELLILGAEAKADALEARGGAAVTSRGARIDEFLALRAGETIDAGAGLALHDGGWVRDT